MPPPGDPGCSSLSTLILPEELLHDKNSQVQLYSLCGDCRRICSESQVLNNEEWHHQSAMRSRDSLPGHAKTFTFGGSSDNVGGMGSWNEGYFPESFVFHQTVESFLSAARSGCHLCTILACQVQTHYRSWTKTKFSWSAVQAALRGGPFRLAIAWECDFSGTTIYYRLVLIDDELDLLSHAEFCRISLASPEDPVKGLLARNDPVYMEARTSITTESDAYFRLACHWIQECRSSHQACLSWSETPGFCPTRLLDVGPPDGSQCPRLHICSQTDESVDYLTLSHCWGTTNEVYRLTTDTMAEMLSGVNESKLPRNFRDAITACRKLGKRYIWIDSLCIVQNSKEDWNREAPLMASIYSNSYCTIAAQCAADSSKGFFRLRNPRRFNPCRLPVKLHLSASALSPHTRTTDRDFPDDRPLYERAWVLQERLLSPRILKFGESALSWECQQCLGEEDALAAKAIFIQQGQTWDGRLSAEERDSKLGNSFTRFCSASNLEESSNWANFIESWQVLVENYTAMLLSFPSDRMAAFAGIVGFQEQRSGLTYVDGLWVDFLLPMLLWYTHDPGGERDAESFLPGTDGDPFVYRAPLHFNSLSWASVESSVEFFDSLPFWHLDRSRVAGIMNLADDKSRVIRHDVAEQCFQVTDYERKRDHYLHPDTKKRSAGKRRRQAVAPQSYCANLIAIIRPEPSDTQPRAATVVLEGPTYAFTTRRAGPSERNWSNPYLEDSCVTRYGWFQPDLRSLQGSMAGTALDVVCLAISELTPGVENTSTSVHSAGVVLVENLGHPGLYSRVGFFDFWYYSDVAYKEARQKAVHRQLYVV